MFFIGANFECTLFYCSHSHKCVCMKCSDITLPTVCRIFIQLGSWRLLFGCHVMHLYRYRYISNESDPVQRCIDRTQTPSVPLIQSTCVLSDRAGRESKWYFKA